MLRFVCISHTHTFEIIHCDRHLSAFQFFTILKSAAINILVQTFLYNFPFTSLELVLINGIV